MSENPLKRGVDGRFVDCRPLQDDPLVIEKRHRASCLLQQLTPRCTTCKNGNFTLFFEPPEKRLEHVQCPRWEDKGGAARMKGELPTSYVTTEIATCEEKPFEFCPSCPSKEVLGEISIEKDKEGWYNIWKRARDLLIQKMEDEDE